MAQGYPPGPLLPLYLYPRRMTLDKASKEELAQELTGIFNTAKIGFLLDYRGMTVEQTSDLRRKLFGAHSAMRVLKNRVAKLALKGTPFQPIADKLVDTRALVYGDNPVELAKVLNKYLSENEKAQLVTAFFVNDAGGEVLSKAQIKELASLPSREELIAKLLFMFNAPQTQLVRTLNEVPAKFVRTLAAIGQAKGNA